MLCLHLLPKKVIQQAVEASSMQPEEYVQQGGRLLGRHGERYGPGTCSRGGAGMKSGTRVCCEVRLGVVTEGDDLLQRLSRQRGSGQSRLGGGSSSTLSELFPAVKLENNEKHKQMGRTIFLLARQQLFT